MTLWRETFGQAQSRWQLAGWLLTFAFPVFALIVDKAASTIYAVFFLAGLWLLLRGKGERPDPYLRWVLIAFAAYFLVGVLSFFLGEQTRLGEKLLGRDIRFLGAVVVYVSLARIAIPAKATLSSLAAAGIVTGVVAVMEMLLVDKAGHRASGETISILFGHLAAGLAIVNAGFAIRERAKRYLFVLGATGAAVATLLSGTRGAVLSVVAILVFLVVREFRHRGTALSRALFSGLLLIVLAAVFANQNLRLKSVVTELVEYRDQLETVRMLDWPAMPACFNDREFLKWMVESSITSGAADLDIDIVPITKTDIWSVSGFNCSGGFAVSIRNPDKQHAGWIYLPARSVPPGDTGGALIVQGTSQISLAQMPPEARMHVDADEPILVTIEGSLSADSRYLLVFAPGNTVKFAPVVYSESEYAFTNQTSSFGSRLLLWDAAIETFGLGPLMGKGVGAFPSTLRERAMSGEAPWQITQFDHAHNEILTVAAERGIIGLITLFGVYAAPFWLFWRRRDEFGWAGMAFVASIFLSGLTETIFNHSLGITYYCMLILLLATAPREPVTDAQASPSNNPL